MTQITLCMIVRDEEALLGGCLASVAGAVDRIVVIDTGSTDRTREIAREHGAYVVEHVWTDDFAAARNVALEHVKDGFILLLDADERLAKGAGHVLRQAVERGRVDCGVLPLHNAAKLDARPEDVLSGAERRGEPVLLPRLLRRTPDLAWRGVVHENVDAWIATGKPRVKRVDANIVHYGAVPDMRIAREKNLRNLRLLEKRCAIDPADAVARTYLAHELERAGDRPGATREADRAWTDLFAMRAAGINVDLVSLATLRSFLAVRADRLDLAREILDIALGTAPDHPNIQLMYGVLEERTALCTRDDKELSAHLARAERSYRACVESGGKLFLCEILPGATDWLASTRLGTVLLMQGRADEAARCFQSALELRPDHVEARLGRAEAEAICGDPSRALRDLEPLMSDDSIDAWILGALACVRLGLMGDAAAFGLEAQRRATSRAPLASHRMHMLREIMDVALEGAPSLIASAAEAGVPTADPAPPETHP